MPKYPNIEIQLTGQDGNGFYIIGKCLQAMRHNRLPQAEMDEFKKQATSGDYDYLLATCIEWFDVS